jgi:hypothetical protein
MASSYAGDCFQQLAQAWLVATLTGSALAVGWIATLGSIPQLFIPLVRRVRSASQHTQVEMIPTPTEEDFFRQMGVPRWAPEQRTERRLMQFIRQSR